MADPKQIYNHLLTAFTLAEGTNVQDRLFDAWSKTKNLRENGNCGDENLAVAEHYLYARYTVATDGHTNHMKFLVLAYSSVKALGLKGVLPKTGKCEVSPFSRLSYQWGSQGADDGLNDYLLGSKTSNYELRPPDLPQ